MPNPDQEVLTAYAVGCSSVFTPPEDPGGFLCLVPGLAKLSCTKNGGDCVDADGNPLLIIPLWQNALLLNLESGACPRFTPKCLWDRNVQDAAFCW